MKAAQVEQLSVNRQTDDPAAVYVCVCMCVRERVSVCVRPDMDTTGAHC